MRQAELTFPKGSWLDPCSWHALLNREEGWEMSLLITAPDRWEPRAVEAVRLGDCHRQGLGGGERQCHGVTCPDSKLRGLARRAVGDLRAMAPSKSCYPCSRQGGACWE